MMRYAKDEGFSISYVKIFVFLLHEAEQNKQCKDVTLGSGSPFFSTLHFHSC